MKNQLLSAFGRGRKQRLPRLKQFMDHRTGKLVARFRASRAYAPVAPVRPPERLVEAASRWLRAEDGVYQIMRPTRLKEFRDRRTGETVWRRRGRGQL